jgi:hypothetical protein
MENKNDQVQEESPVEEEVQEEQSEETQEEPVVEQEQEQGDSEQLIKALQKGYTQQAQQIADLRRKLELPTEQTTQPAEEAVEPQTYEEMKKDLVSSLKEELTAPQREQEERDALIDQDLDTLYTAGKINSPEEQNKFLKFGQDVAKDLGSLPRPLQLFPLYEKFLEAQRKGEEAKAKKEVQQDAGSQVGKSSKPAKEESNVPSYSDIHNTDIFNL